MFKALSCQRLPCHAHHAHQQTDLGIDLDDSEEEGVN